jgi:outer membrane lipoprotein-sorting protein
MKKPQTPQIFSPAFYAGFGLLIAAMGTCWASGCLASSARHRHKVADVNSLDVVLKQLTHKTAKLKSYQCRIEYLFSQPLFESQTLRTGRLYYQKSSRESKLRINFQILKQDDEDQQKHIEHYIFDGVWLTHIDHQIFELVSENFPIIGFNKIEDLKKQFEIKLVEQEKERTSVIPTKAGIQDFIHLHLKVKPDSIYKDDYTSVDFWIDRKLYLPAKIVAVSTEEDIYRIKFLDAKVNEKIDKKVFDFKIPKGFDKEITLLKKKPK